MIDAQYLRIAQIVAESSKCISLQVGAVLVRDGRIISIGYNGTPPGYYNCCDLHSERGPVHSAWSDKYEIHAEQNCLLWAARNGIETEGSTMYLTLEPCHQCLKMMAAAGIARIVFSDHYYREESSSDEKGQFARDLEIPLEHHPIDEAKGEDRGIPLDKIDVKDLTHFRSTPGDLSAGYDMAQVTLTMPSWMTHKLLKLLS